MPQFREVLPIGSKMQCASPYGIVKEGSNAGHNHHIEDAPSAEDDACQ